MNSKPPAPLAIRSQVDSLLHSTVRIEADLPGAKRSIGTGFFMRYSRGEDYFPALVTNKHVVEGAIGGRIFLHRARVAPGNARQPSGEVAIVEVADFPNIWINHPVHSDDPDESDDPSKNIDLCGAPLGPVIKEFEARGDYLFPLFLGDMMIPADDDLRQLQVMEDVVMVGYPSGLWDDVHGFPLFRKGMTATHPYIDFRGWPVGALDIGAYWGSSGSPVVLLRRGVDYSVDLRPVNIPVLLGVLFGGPPLQVKGTVELAGVPTGELPPTSTVMPMHLGYYIKARELWTLRDEMYRRLGISPSPQTSESAPPAQGDTPAVI